MNIEDLLNPQKMKKPSELFEGENSSLRKTFNEAIKEKILSCPKCHKSFRHAWDDFTGCISDYLYEPACQCYPKDIIISVG